MKSPELHTEQHRQEHGATATNAPPQGNESFISATFLKWALSILFAYFGARLVYFALNIAAFVPPDEVTHAGICTVFSKIFLLPDNSPDTYEFGLVTNIPWLYYWTMGKLLHLNFFGVSDLVFLRLLNIPLAFGTVWYAVRLLSLLTTNRLTTLLLVVVMTNTPMFSFLSASVSSDNLTNLLAAMAFYYLFTYLRENSAGLLAASLLCQLAGCLTKITFLPLVLALNVLLIMSGFRNLIAFPAAVMHYYRTSARRALLSIVLLFIAVGLNLHLYAGNYLHYGGLNLEMKDVLPKRAAMQNRTNARGLIFKQYKEGRISYMDALILTGEIKHPGDKADTFYLLMNYENLKRNPALWLGPIDYSKVWARIMLSTIFGIKAHLQIYKGAVSMMAIYAVIGLAGLGFVMRWRPRKDGWLPPALMTVAIIYTGYLMYYFNYGSYKTYGEPSLTVYGRYLFPVMTAVSVVMCHYLLLLFRSGYGRWVLALATAALFISYDFPWFLMNTTPEWYQWMPR
jgi:hypothetical protein